MWLSLPFKMSSFRWIFFIRIHGNFIDIWESLFLGGGMGLELRGRKRNEFKLIYMIYTNMPVKKHRERWCFRFISSVQFSRSVVSDSLRPHELQHIRPPYPSPTPRVYPNSCPLSWWCHPTISSSVVPSPPVLNLSQHQGLFKWVSSSHPKYWSLDGQSGQSIGVSAST